MAHTTVLPPMGFLAVEVEVVRPPGDPYNERTWDFPLIREKVTGTVESQLVTKTAYDDSFIDRFVAAGKKLADRGAIGIITSCGFLALAQKQLAARLPIPIATSSLIQIPPLQAMNSAGQLIGVMTYDASRLSDAHLTGLGIDLASIRISGAPDNGHLRGTIARGEQYDAEKLKRELIEQAKQLIADHNDIVAVVLECTNMAPYGEQIQESIGLPVYDVFTLGSWFYSGIARRNPQRWQQ